jgi:hypothetical protein
MRKEEDDAVAVIDNVELGLRVKLCSACIQQSVR